MTNCELVEAFHAKCDCENFKGLPVLPETTKSALRVTCADLTRASKVLYDLAASAKKEAWDTLSGQRGEELNKSSLAYLRVAMSLEEMREGVQAMIDGNREEFLDALADRMFLTWGDAITYGFQHALTPAFEEVCYSNLSKQGKDKSGKIVKGETYNPPNLTPILHLYGLL
jgi:Phosphoribosyl-ATP pyrophosphohydrolase.